MIESRQLEGIVIAIGDNWVRAAVSRTIREISPTIAFPNVFHPSAQIGTNVRLGCGNVAMAGAIVNGNTRLGDFVSFAPKSCAGGEVEVGDYAAVCLGANVIHGIRIGRQTIVGAGSTMLNDLPESCVAFGTPARSVRQRVVPKASVTV